MAHKFSIAAMAMELMESLLVRKPATVMYPIERLTPPDRFRGMCILYGRGHILPRRPQAQYGNPGSRFQGSCPAPGNRFKRAFPVRVVAVTPGVADGYRPRIFQLGGVEHVAQFQVVHGGCQLQIGDASEVGNVKNPMVGCPVPSHQAGAVQTKHHREVLEGHVVDDLVVPALEEGGIDGAVGGKSFGGHPGSQGDRVLFGDAHIKTAIRKGLHHVFQGTARWHGRGNPYDIFVIPGKFHQGMPEDILVFGSQIRGFFAPEQVSRGFVEPAGGVVGHLVFLGLLQALALGGDQVQQPGAGFGLLPLEFPDKPGQVMAVHGAGILQVQAFKQVFTLAPSFFNGGQIFLQGPHAGVDPYGVVVQDDQQVGIGNSCVV